MAVLWQPASTLRMASVRTRPEAAKASGKGRFEESGGIGWTFPLAQNSGECRNAVRAGQANEAVLGNGRGSSETILPSAKCPENRLWIVQRLPAVGTGGCGHCRIVAAQKGVGGQLGTDVRRQRDAVGFAQARRFGKPLGDGRVGGFHGPREAQIAQCVFVGAVDTCLRWQRGKALQRVEHLFDRAFEQAAATGCEQRVAAEEPGGLWIIVEIGDMAERMPRHLYDL